MIKKSTQAKTEPKKVLVFGTFDGLHDGHLYFLSEAKKLGELYVSVASDESVLQRKGRAPKQSAEQRLEAIKNMDVVTEVSIGDKTLNKWSDLKRVLPNVIAVGFDQFGLKTVLQDIQNQYKFEIVKINKKADAIP